MYKHIHKILINSLLVVLLLGILVMPFTSIGLMGYKTYENNSQVLSAQDSEDENNNLKFPQWDMEKEKGYLDSLSETQESTESTETEQITE